MPGSSSWPASAEQVPLGVCRLVATKFGEYIDDLVSYKEYQVDQIVPLDYPLWVKMVNSCGRAIAEHPSGTMVSGVMSSHWPSSTGRQDGHRTAAAPRRPLRLAGLRLHPPDLREHTGRLHVHPRHLWNPGRVHRRLR